VDEEWHHEVLAEDFLGGLAYTVQADHVHANLSIGSCILFLFNISEWVNR